MTNQVKILHRTPPSTLLTSQLTAYRYISQEAHSQIQSAIKSNPVVLFMKGTPAEPQCGFSRAVVQILDIHGVPAEKMRTYNVLADEELRTAIKEFSLVPYSSSDIIDCKNPLHLTATGPQFLKYTSMVNLLVDVIFYSEVSYYVVAHKHVNDFFLSSAPIW